MFEDCEVIHTYSRQEAIDDGTLIDISNYTPEGELQPLIKQLRFKYPIAFTSAAYACVDLPEDFDGPQDLSARLWDVLYMLNLAVFCSPKADNEICFKAQIMDVHDWERKEIIFKAVIGPGDNMEPVITVMMPNED